MNKFFKKFSIQYLIIILIGIFLLTPLFVKADFLADPLYILFFIPIFVILLITFFVSIIYILLFYIRKEKISKTSGYRLTIMLMLSIVFLFFILWLFRHFLLGKILFLWFGGNYCIMC